jgi:hypothetical protein
MKDEKSDFTLGQISKGKYDTKLEGDKPAPTQHHKSTHSVPDRLQLPKGALVAFRRSGGLKFSSREIAIYPNGRITYGGTDVPRNASARVPQKLTDAQIASVRQLLDKANFFRSVSSKGQQPPDAMAFEIAAQADNRSSYIEVFEGKIQDSLMPLIQQLSKLIPLDQ